MILVFGSGGQVGSELMALAAARGVAAVGLGHSEADIADAGAVARAIERVRPDFVVNCAAYNQVDRAEDDAPSAIRANVDGPAVLARETARQEIPLLHFSTDYVFSGDRDGAWTETDPVAPLSVYGRTKAWGEAKVREGNERHFILRTAWVFGTYGANFVKTVVRLARERDRLDMISDTRGSPTLSRDLAEAVLLAHAAVRDSSPRWGTYHVAGSEPASRYDMAQAIVAAQAPFTGRRPAVHAVTSAAFPAPAPRPRNGVLDSAKFVQVFGFRPTAWRPAIEETVVSICKQERAA